MQPETGKASGGRRGPKGGFAAHSSGAMREKMLAPTYDQMPLCAHEAYGRVANYGEVKYAAWNWAKGLPQRQIMGSLMRHLVKYMQGEDFDVGPKGSGLPHTDHIVWNAVALCFNFTYGIEDDRRKLPAEVLALMQNAVEVDFGSIMNRAHTMKSEGDTVNVPTFEEGAQRAEDMSGGEYFDKLRRDVQDQMDPDLSGEEAFEQLDEIMEGMGFIKIGSLDDLDLKSKLEASVALGEKEEEHGPAIPGVTFKDIDVDGVLDEIAENVKSRYLDQSALMLVHLVEDYIPDHGVDNFEAEIWKPFFLAYKPDALTVDEFVRSIFNALSRVLNNYELELKDDDNEMILVALRGWLAGRYELE